MRPTATACFLCVFAAHTNRGADLIAGLSIAVVGIFHNVSALACSALLRLRQAQLFQFTAQ